MTRPVLLTLLLLASPLLSAGDLIEGLMAPLAEVDDATQSVHRQMVEKFRSEDYAAATGLAEIVVKTLQETQGASAPVLVRPYINLATLKWLGRDLDSAMAGYGDAIAIIEAQQGQYAPDLIPPLTALGQIRLLQGKTDEADGLFRRAQHISHRNFGVYTMDQIDLVRHLAQAEEARGNVPGSRLQHQFMVRINEATFGADDPRILPALQEQAAYLQAQGDYRGAVDHLLRSMRIIQDHYGANDLRLSQPLEAIGRIGMYDPNYSSRGKKAVERRSDLMREHQDADLREKVLSLIAVGDFRMVTKGPNQAGYIYRLAWEMMADRPESVALRAEAFGKPTRLVPPPGTTYLIERFPAQPDEALYADIEFTVEATGRVADVEVVKSNVPQNRIRYLARSMGIFRYRPRMEGGILVETKPVSLRLQLEVVVPSSDAVVRTQAGLP